jgi:CheY-like chemotaxis protein
MGKACLLIVEDEQDSLELLKVVVMSEGYHATTAEDGSKAIDLLNHIKPALIVTDLMMPNLDGIDLIKHVRNSPTLKDIPIIVITGTSRTDIERSKLAGATKVIRKPIDITEFVLNLREFIPARKPNA